MWTLDIVSGIPCGSIYGIFILTFYLAFLCHMLWHSIPILYSIWHLFWHTIWHIFWHYFWHSICTCSDILSGIYSGILSGTYSGILFWHSFWQSIWLSIWHLFWYSIWHSILAFFLAFYLAFILTIFLAFIWQKASGWGPAVPTEIWSSRLRSGCWFGDSHTLSKCSLSFVSQWRGCSNDWDLALQIYNIQCLNSLSCLLGVATRYDLLRKVDSVMTGLIRYQQHLRRALGAGMLASPVHSVVGWQVMPCSFTAAAGCRENTVFVAPTNWPERRTYRVRCGCWCGWYSCTYKSLILLIVFCSSTFSTGRSRDRGLDGKIAGC